MAKPSFDSVTEEPCACGSLLFHAAISWSPIVFDAELNEYNFEYLVPRRDPPGEFAKATMRINHCPFCGGATPSLARASMFALVTPEEAERLNQLLAGLTSPEDAIRVLGAPNEDSPCGVITEQLATNGKPSSRRSYRVLIYTRLSDTANVRLTDWREDGLQVTLEGKQLDRPRAQAEPDTAPQSTE